MNNKLNRRVMKDKISLRKKIRNEKRLHSEAELQELSCNICKRILQHPKVKSARTLLLYWALPDEVRTEELVQTLVNMGKEVLLPRVVSDTEMTIHRFMSVNDLQKGAYGILEPMGEKVEIEVLKDAAREAKTNGEDCVAIVPGMAFDRYGHRLGRGKGYYDRFLRCVAGMYRIGICYPFQMVDCVPTTEHDVMMNEVINC